MAAEQAFPEEMNMMEIGSTGLNRWSGYVHEEFLPELQGFRWRRVVREMTDNDPIIGAIIFAISMMVRQVGFHVVASKDGDAKAEQWRDFVHECIFEDMDLSFSDVLSEIISFIWWGWSALEMSFKVRAGDKPGKGEDGRPLPTSKFKDRKIGFARWGIRAQETLDRWEFAPNGDVIGLWQNPPPDYITRPIPREKFLHFRSSVSKGNPEGRSILRNAYRPWYFKKKMESIEAIGVERDLAGLPVALVPPEVLASDANTANAAILEQIKKVITNIRRDESEGVVFPMAYNGEGKLRYELKLLSTGGSRQFDTNEIITRYDQRVAMVVLADWVLLGHEKVGSFALLDGRTDVFALALTGWVDEICDEINRQGIALLCRLNGVPQEYWPKLAHDDIENIDPEKVANYINTLATAGFTPFPNPAIERNLLERIGVPVPDDYEEQREKEIEEAEKQEQEAQALLAQAAMAGTAPSPDAPGAQGTPPVNGKKQERPQKPQQAPRAASERSTVRDKVFDLLDSVVPGWDKEAKSMSETHRRFFFREGR